MLLRSSTSLLLRTRRPDAAQTFLKAVRVAARCQPLGAQRRQYATPNSNTPAEDDPQSRKEEIREEKEAIAQLSLYGKMKRYGPPAMFIYLVIHCAGFWLVFFLLMSGVPVRKYLAEYLPLPSEGQSSDEEGGAKGALQAIPWAELGLALVINKMFGPLQILLTLSITPRLAPILLSWGPTKTMVSGITTIISYFKWKQA
eukprot:TRINITY_DN15080_c0_g1_i1.p1 TRINITY_DN15080_c0_g1~~TRINITY_DN15080_c0_g1_i1.p1  ORF type:complete len:209 (+),score=59.75 TRINITY_DN15080_c0_g1_i1:30-629(+)